jgi:hypothetical protein
MFFVPYYGGDRMVWAEAASEAEGYLVIGPLIFIMI